MYSSESVVQVLLADGRDPTALWADLDPSGVELVCFLCTRVEFLFCARGGTQLGGLHSDRDEIERYVTVG